MRRDRVIKMVQRILGEATFTLRQLSEDGDLSYSALRAWAIGRRAPSAENLRRIAGALRTRADKLRALAKQLERAADRVEE